jgi:hypothetical protein
MCCTALVLLSRFYPDCPQGVNNSFALLGALGSGDVVDSFGLVVD